MKKDILGVLIKELDKGTNKVMFKGMRLYMEDHFLPECVKAIKKIK